MNSRPICLFSTAATTQYREALVQAITYPTGHVLTDIPYRLDLVHSELRNRPEGLVGEDCFICYVDYVSGENDVPEQLYYPLRTGKIRKKAIVARKLLLDVQVGDYVYYSPEIAALYARLRVAPDTLEKSTTIAEHMQWNAMLRKQLHTLRAVATTEGRPMRFGTSQSWRSGESFVVRSTEELDFNPGLNEAALKGLRVEQVDWQSVVEQLSETDRFRRNIFYRMLLLRESDEQLSLKRDAHFHPSVYDLAADDRANLIFHFWLQMARVPFQKPTYVGVSAESQSLSVIGRNVFQVHHDASSGQFERIQLVAKKQMASQLVHISIRGCDAIGNPDEQSDLQGTDLFIWVSPKQWIVALVLVLFFAGSVLGSMDGPYHALKFVGAAFSTAAFLIGFTKLPTDK